MDADGFVERQPQRKSEARAPKRSRWRDMGRKVAEPRDAAKANPAKLPVANSASAPTLSPPKKTGAHWFRLLVRVTCCMPGKSVILVINPGKKTNANYDEELALAA